MNQKRSPLHMSPTILYNRKGEPYGLNLGYSGRSLNDLEQRANALARNWADIDTFNVSSYHNLNPNNDNPTFFLYFKLIGGSEGMIDEREANQYLRQAGWENPFGPFNSKWDETRVGLVFPNYFSTGDSNLRENTETLFSLCSNLLVKGFRDPNRRKILSYRNDQGNIGLVLAREEDIK